jgi:hypothetical protein
MELYKTKKNMKRDILLIITCPLIFAKVLLYDTEMKRTFKNSLLNKHVFTKGKHLYTKTNM